jgi:hypothetical protein
MSRILKTRRAKTLVGTMAIMAVAAVAAFAYFTTTGTGTGSATTGTSSAVTLHGTAPDTLYPGTSSIVNFTVDNPSSGHQLVNVIHLDSVSTDPAHSTCDVSKYTMPDVSANQDVPSGSATVIAATGTLTFNNAAVSQDACKGAPLTLHLSSN